MWYVIPLLILGIGTILIGGALWVKNDFAEFLIGITFIILIILSIILCPVQYYTSRVDALQIEQYYNSFIIPNKIAETSTTITVSSLTPGVWQAGTFNVTSFNSALIGNRYWIQVPIINSVIYPLPNYLKLVIVQ